MLAPGKPSFEICEIHAFSLPHGTQAPRCGLFPLVRFVFQANQVSKNLLAPPFIEAGDFLFQLKHAHAPKLSEPMQPRKYSDGTAAGGPRPASYFRDVDVFQFGVPFHCRHSEIATDAALFESAEWSFDVDT